MCEFRLCAVMDVTLTEQRSLGGVDPSSAAGSAVDSRELQAGLDTGEEFGWGGGVQKITMLQSCRL